MSTTPSTFKPYTVVGGAKDSRIIRHSCHLTILILNRHGIIYREQFLKSCELWDFADILCVEGPRLSYDLESQSEKFPRVRFLLLKEDLNTGGRINMGMEESRSKCVLVVWSDMRITDLNPDIVRRIEEENRLCTVPHLRTERGETVPSLFLPVFERGGFRAVPWKSFTTGSKTLYPFDFCGLYNREKFRAGGGYDPQISNPYWQKLDFGLRNILWGEEIVGDTAMHYSYQGDIIPEDNTPDAGYKVFYLKNLAVKHTHDIGCLPFYRFPGYALRSDTGPVYSFKEFLEARRWVKQHASRFLSDVRTISSQWEVSE